MNANTRQEAQALLVELCVLSPDVRLGQLLAHLGFLGEDQTGRTLWDIEDDQFLAVLQQHRAELVDRVSDANNSTMASVASLPRVQSVV